jgi:hypothetical protein
MTLLFDFDHIEITEFGIGIDRDNERHFSVIPVDADVQTALQEMAAETWRLMFEKTNAPGTYQPSEKYASTEYLVLPIEEEMVAPMRQLQEASNLEENIAALKQTDSFFAYFARFADNQHRRLTAVRRTSQFKGVLKKRLIRLGDNTLQIVPDKVFKLDNDFDYFIDANQFHILRPSGLEFTAQLQEAVMAAVTTNIASIASDLNFVDFSTISEYAQTHARAARYLASIRSQAEARNVSKSKLKTFCNRTGVTVSESSGKIAVDDANVMGFLEVLDRRRYEVDLTADENAELYRASGRSKISP